MARLHAFGRADLESGARRFRRRRGVVQLRLLVALVDPTAESQRESWVRLDIIDAGLPTPEVQWRVLDDGVEVWRLDLAYPAQKVAVEYDGEEWHLLTRQQVERDARRRRWLRNRGWTVIVVTKADLGGVNAEWLEDLKEALRPRTQRFRWEGGRQN